MQQGASRFHETRLVYVVGDVVFPQTITNLPRTNQFSAPDVS